ncbi:DUF2513 domain-containing protein [Metapseudomonas otitidis]|uniref:DUF2513 domain-containing protein n=1 Tax=Metapseudomonas otitidis TaxID=319939 RepID=UPI00227B49BF|nr:DUF2513 domain-containing protein [Pseudomonas otitidis]WAF83571.1 DUF2513 domain-containing protein [Pseudomonas otitidis]
MKRDWDLIRSLLMAVEALEGGRHFAPRAWDGHSAAQVAHHLHLLAQGGLVECATHHPWNGEPVMIATGLTLAGHDLLDRLGDDATWAARKADLLAREGAITLDGLLAQGLPPRIPEARRLRVTHADARID